MKNNNIILRRASLADANAIHQMMLEIYENLEDKSLFVCDDLEFVKNHIENEGFAIIVCDHGKIVGGFIFRFPGLQEDNLGRELGLDDNELNAVVHMESVVVSPEYRGNRLQQRMLEYGMSLLDQNQYKYLMATVSPDNPASYKTLEKCGFSHIATRIKYNGLMRRIYVKENC